MTVFCSFPLSLEEPWSSSRAEAASPAVPTARAQTRSFLGEVVLPHPILPAPALGTGPTPTGTGTPFSALSGHLLQSKVIFLVSGIYLPRPEVKKGG